MREIARLDQELNQMILNGQALEGLEKFYAEDVVMQENTEPPTVGKDANREREVAFYNSISEVHAAEVLSRAVGDDVTFSEWVFDFTLKHGPRNRMTQTAVRRWKGNKITHERFYYNAG